MRGLDELWDRRRRSEVSDPSGFHDVFYGAITLNEGEDTHPPLAFGAPGSALAEPRSAVSGYGAAASKGSISNTRLTCLAVVPSGTKADARGPTTPPELSPIVAFCFLLGTRCELSAFPHVVCRSIVRNPWLETRRFSGCDMKVEPETRERQTSAFAQG